MDRDKAERVRGSIDSDNPFYSRVACVETHATLLSLYDDEVNTSSNAGRSLRQSILFAVQPHRSEWCFNGAQARHASSQAMLEFLPSGTTANEALHHELNVWLIDSTALHVASLNMKMHGFLCAKLMSHHCAFLTTQPAESTRPWSSCAHWGPGACGRRKIGRRGVCPRGALTMRKSVRKLASTWLANALVSPPTCPSGMI